MSPADLAGRVDFTLAFSTVHELPTAARFLGEAAAISKASARLLPVEPVGHVKAAQFEAELKAAAHAGFNLEDGPSVRRGYATLLREAY